MDCVCSKLNCKTAVLKLNNILPFIFSEMYVNSIPHSQSLT